VEAKLPSNNAKTNTIIKRKRGREEEGERGRA